MSAFRYTEGYQRGELRGWVAGTIIGTVIALFIAAFVAILMAIILAISIPVGRGICNRWEEQTGVETKFVRLNLFDTGTCLAKAPDGRWVKNTSVQVFIPGGKK